LALVVGFALVFAAGFAAALEAFGAGFDGDFAGFAAGFAAGFTVVLLAGLATGFEADFAAVLAAGFTLDLLAGLATGFDVAFGAAFTTFGAALGFAAVAALAAGLGVLLFEMILLSFATLSALGARDRARPRLPRKPRFFELSCCFAIGASCRLGLKTGMNRA
jgi:hypothetical protein